MIQLLMPTRKPVQPGQTRTHPIIARNIRLYREAAGKTQKELGMAMGFGEDTAQARIYQYESGERSPNKRTLERIADILGRPFQEFFQEHRGVVQSSDLERELHMLTEEASKYGSKGIRKLRKMLPALFEDDDDRREDTPVSRQETIKRRSA